MTALKTNDLADKLGAVVYNEGNPTETIKGGYAGDFLSFVIGKAPEHCAWFTVMSNVNVCAVATLAGIGAIVLCEGVKPSEQLLEAVKTHNVNLIGTELDIYGAAVKFSQNEN
jgi:hypothetical protein